MENGGFTEIAVAIRVTAAPAVVPQKWPLGKLYNPVVCTVRSDTEFFLARSINLMHRLNVC